MSELQVSLALARGMDGAYHCRGFGGNGPASRVERPAARPGFDASNSLTEPGEPSTLGFLPVRPAILIANARRIQEVACSTTSTIRRSSSPGSGASDFRPVAMQGALLARRENGRQHLTSGAQHGAAVRGRDLAGGGGVPKTKQRPTIVGRTQGGRRATGGRSGGRRGAGRGVRPGPGRGAAYARRAGHQASRCTQTRRSPGFPVRGGRRWWRV